MIIYVTNAFFFFLFPGSGDNVQLPNVPAHNAAGVELGVGLGKEGGDMVNGWSTSHRPRRLLQVQGQHPTLLQEEPHSCGLAAWGALQPADRQLLQRRCRRLVGAGPLCRRLLLPGERRALGGLQQDCQAAQELHPHGPRPRLHLQPG